MTDNTEQAILVAQVAEKIIELSKDGKVVTVHMHYPTKADAISYGFCCTLGGIFALCFATFFGTLGHFAIKAVFP